MQNQLAEATVTANGGSQFGERSEEPVLLRADNNGVTTLTLNRPKQFNALSQALLTTLQTELDLIAQDETIRVVVIAANGKAFCAGHDLKEMRAHTDKAFHSALFEQCSQMMLTINRMPQPVLAKVQGLATAARLPTRRRL